MAIKEIVHYGLSTIKKKWTNLVGEPKYFFLTLFTILWDVVCVYVDAHRAPFSAAYIFEET